MRKIILAVAIALIALPAFADSTAISGSAAGAISGSASGSNASPVQAITFNNPRENHDVSLKTVPDVVAPGLVASFAECFGSTSGGISVLGFGASAGTTTVDSDCNRRRDANSAVGLGEVAIGYQVMCASPNFFAADQATKKACKVYPKGMEPKPEQQPVAKMEQLNINPPKEARIEPVAFLSHK